MAMHRSNKAPRTVSRQATEQWFNKNVKRQRNRKEMAKASKRKNRGKK